MVFVPLTSVGATGVALVDDLLFWGHDAPIGVLRANRATLDAASTVELDDQMPAEAVSGVATDDVKVYWIAGDRVILSASATGAPAAPKPVCDDLGDDAGFGANADVAVDDEWIYFTRPSAGLIQKCKKP